MDIISLMSESSISFVTEGNELITNCPYCNHTTGFGEPVATLNIDTVTGSAHCSACKKSTAWEALAKKLSLLKKSQKKKRDAKPSAVVKETLQATPEEPAKRVKKLQVPEQPLSYKEWRDIVASHFPDLVLAAEAGVSVMAQLLIKDITNPFALVFVDVPSAGKTIAVNFFAGIKDLAYATDKFSPAAFVSNAANVPREKLKEIDLLPRLQYKVFIIRDLATLFSKRDDDLSECLGILTRVLDGEGLNTDSGVHGQREYDGEYLFMILAASTPIQPRVLKVMGNLGSRLFFLSLNSKDKSISELAGQLKGEAHKRKETTCRTATSDFLKTLWNANPDGVEWNKKKDPDEALEIISRSAKLLASLRGVINIYSDSFGEFGNSNYKYSTPLIEKPDRINQLFYNLARGHALACGRKNILKEDLKLMLEIVADSAPMMRAKLFRKLIEHGGTMTTDEVEKALMCSKPTALDEMEKLKILGIARLEKNDYAKVGGQTKEIFLLEDFNWFLSEECKEIRNG